ncbi:MAG: hypothetical protein AAF806_01680 [Bacteroidota bacterium]
MEGLYKKLGYLGIGRTAIFILAILYYQNREMYFIGGIMLLLFGGLGIPIFMYYKNHNLRFNDDQIVVQSWLKKTTEIKWSEISQIQFNPFSGYIKIEGDSENVRINQHLVGLKAFLEKMEEKTKWTVKELKFPIEMD